MSKKKKFLIVLASLVLVVAILFGGFYIYSLDYYRADGVAIKASAVKASSVEKIDNLTVFYPDKKTDLETAFIFIPVVKLKP